MSDDLEADGDDSYVVGSTLTNLAAGEGVWLKSRAR